MRTTIIKWSTAIAALCVFGPLAGTLMAQLTAIDGRADATPLVSTTPVLGIGFAVLAVVVAASPGLIGARLAGVNPGFTPFGMALAWAAWRSGTTEGLIRAWDPGSIYPRLAVEALIVGVVAVAGAALIEAVGTGRGKAIGTHLRSILAESKKPASLGAIGAGVVAGAIAGWLVAQTGLKGQSVAAGAAAGLAATAIGRLVCHTFPVTACFVAVVLIAVIAGASGAIMHPGHEALVALVGGTLFPLARPVPLDWLAGGLIGIPLGVWWTHSVTEKKHA